MKKILVIGSYNVGLCVIGDKIPALGETVMGHRFEMGPGGKGSNQAIALARLGADIKFMCRVGDDHFGEEAIALFKREAVSLDAVKIIPGSHTGVGVILIDKDGYNAIGVAPGANFRLLETDLDESSYLFEESDFLLIQCENPVNIVRKAIAMAKEKGNLVIFNPAPAHEIDSLTLSKTDFITPNETEAQILTGITVTDETSAYKAGETLLDKGAKNVIVTLGEKGAVLITPYEHKFFPAFKVNTKDSTGAGDAFNGGFVFGLANGYSTDEAIVFASKVAALSVRKIGTVNGLPTFEEVLEFKAGK